VLRDPAGETWMRINLLSSVSTDRMPDETWQVDGVSAEAEGADIVLTVRTRSTAWKTHLLTLRCTPETVELSVTVEGVRVAGADGEGAGRLTDVTVFGGEASRPAGASGTFRSGIRYRSLLAPVPTEPVQLVRPSRSAAVLGVVGDADPGRLNGIFSPPPLVLGLGREQPAGATEVPGGEWLGLSLRAPVQDLTFTTLRYEPLDGGFLLRLNYEGHTAVSGSWTSPVFVLRPSATGWGVIDDHRRDLIEHGLAKAERREEADWWREPIFCGWGAQCARAVHLLHAAKLHTSADPVADTLPETPEEEDEVAKTAPRLAREDVYDEFLSRLESAGLTPGTIVIDDRWQAEYGTATVATNQWPDLKGWIAARHAAGQKVLLWWKAWDPEGLPPEECVLDAAGRAIAVDPGNPAYLARLRGIIHSLLSPDGLDADGFKVDFTQRTPSGRTLRASDGTWGIAALHTLLKTVRDAAKQAKPDALVVCHAMHPSFGDVSDMIRLNDVLKRDVNGDYTPVTGQLDFRYEIAHRALPAHPIDTDQWPMPSRAEWLAYSRRQVELGVPALYYLESIDRSGEHIDERDLAEIARTWDEYRARMANGVVVGA
jgi:hypothetical protein